MKKKVLLVALLAFGAVAYAEEAKTVEVAVPETPAITASEVPETPAITVSNEEVLTFAKEKNGEEVIVKSLDNFETATIQVAKKTCDLHRVDSKKGTKLESKDKKISIHFAEGEGVLTENGKEFVVKEKVSK